MTKELQIVSREQAIRLCEVGFDWDCYFAWRLENNEFGEANILVDFQGSNVLPDYAVAPTVALALKWFREEKLMCFSIEYHNTHRRYYYNIWYSHKHFERPDFYTYDEAESALLDALLDLVINDKNNEK